MKSFNWHFKDHLPDLDYESITSFAAALAVVAVIFFLLTHGFLSPTLN